MNGVGIDTSRAFAHIEEAKRSVGRAFTAGSIPQRGDIAAEKRARRTLDPLSVAAPADAAFVLRLADGREAFSQDGGFTLRDGALVDSMGSVVMGYAHRGAPLAPLQIDPVDGALREVHDARIDAAGALRYEREIVDPRTGRSERQSVVAGRIALARFPAGTRLRAIDPRRDLAPEGVIAHLGTPGERGFAELTPNARARSGVDLDASLARLQEAYLTLDALLAAHKAQGAIGKTTMDLLK